MSSNETMLCSRCGTPLPAGAPDRLCPACLMSQALELPDTTTVPLAPEKLQPPLLTEPKAFPCDFGGYRLLRLLGRGGMGAVYEAEEVATGRRLALKMLGLQLDSPDMRQRFLREGRLAARVNHPNSLYIFGSEEIEGHPVITMEIADCGTLGDKLKRNGPLPVAEAVDATLDIIAGLEAAFADGILHRDIKPSNCFISPDGSVKVGDFGLSVSTLARDNSFVTATGVIFGTPSYASPEQLRGDDLDVRADIYSVGATLFSLLTAKAPFEGKNAVQVVANVMNQEARRLAESRGDVPPGLERVVARCLAKEPGQRYPNYAALRDALLPYSSREPEPVSIKVRASAGWIDYLIAFLPAYVILMLLVGAEQLLIQPVVERTVYSARYYLVLLICGFLYFGILEGLWGAGLGKHLKGLCVVRAKGRPPGIGRALIRIAIPVLCVEGVRMPLTMTFISSPDLTGLQIGLLVIVANVCGWIPVLLTLSARRENGFATVWDLATGTRVVIRPKGATRPAVESAPQPEISVEGADSIGPYQILQQLVPGEWLIAADPVLRRQVWLLRRKSGRLSLARQNLARPGRPRWLQRVETPAAIWDAFEASPGRPFSGLVEGGKTIPWSNVRHWLHDLASELCEATRDGTLPAELGLGHVWITAQGQAVLLDEAWPGVKSRVETFAVGDLAGQQRFLSSVAAFVDSTALPLHARSVLQNLERGKFEKLSFLTGTLRGLLNKPATVSKIMRAGSIFLLPLYIWILAFVGYYQGERVEQWSNMLGWLVLITVTVVLCGAAFIQLLELPFRTTISHAIFRLAVVNAKGQPAGPWNLWLRWAIVWLPLFLSLLLVAQFIETAEPAAFWSAVSLLLLWLGAGVYATFHPNRGLHDRWAGTWVVRR